MSEPNAANVLSALSRQVERLADAAAGAAVSIRSHGRPVASGFVWQPGVVVTASDALEVDDDASVTTAGGEAIQAQLAGRDPTTDIAVLRVSEDLAKPVGAGLSEAARVGQMVLAVGRGKDGVTASLGMVSAAGGPWQSRRGGGIDSLVRLDMRLEPQAEGGIVVDSEGRLIGMAVLGPRRKVLVIPMPTIERIAPKLLAEGRIRRGYLGVGVHPIRLDEALAAVHALPERRAIIVVGLDPDGPARKAGVLVGDVVVALDGEAVPGPRSLVARLTPETVDRSVELKLLRAGQMTTARVTVGANPAS